MYRSEWLLVMLVDVGNVIFARGCAHIGAFEITKSREPIAEAELALSQSIASYNYQASSQHMRMRAVLEEASFEEARREGRLHARESLNLLKYGHVFVGPMRLLEPGCLLDLRTLQAYPFINAPVDFGRSLLGGMVIFDHGVTFPLGVINRLTRLDHEQTVELGAAVRRSAHWTELADQAEDLGQRLLLYWMAIECLCRVGKDESISAKVSAAAWFPGGRYEMSLPAVERAGLAAMSEFYSWRRRLNALIEKLRVMRNEIVHSGFREIDLPSRLDRSEVRVATKLLIGACRGAQHMALAALQLGILTIDGMWSRYSECVLFQRQRSLADDVTVLLSDLDNPNER